MALMLWSEHFVTGIDAIDRQHKALVDRVNAAAPLLAMAGERQAREVRPLLDQMIEYAATHFHFEEALMRERGIAPDYLAHQQQDHQAFAEEVARMRRQAEADNNVSGNDLLRFLTNWLTFHILSEDREMARQLRAIEAGVPADQAYTALPADSRIDSAQAVLTHALIDLFSLLGQRNRALTATNEQLLAARNELLKANRQLEDRVEARTRELALSNAELEREQTTLVETMTRFEQTQGQLLQSEKMAAVGQLAAGVAHEINNPVGFVSSNLGSLAAYVAQIFNVIDAAEMLDAAVPAEHPARIAFAEARKTAELDYLRADIPDLLRESADGLARVKRIVNDLKDFSHIDAAQWQATDLNQGLESTLNVVWNEIKYKAQVLKEYGELPPVNCIPSQINQVFMNLLVNAAQAIEDSGSITLRTGVDGGQVWVEIGDTGSGIPSEIQKQIFQPFFTTKPVGKGTGLGLSISWDIVKRHGGRIDVRSSPGQGTTFHIELPIEGNAGEQSMETA